MDGCMEGYIDVPCTRLVQTYVRMNVRTYVKNVRAYVLYVRSYAYSPLRTYARKRLLCPSSDQKQSENLKI